MKVTEGPYAATQQRIVPQRLSWLAPIILAIVWGGGGVVLNVILILMIRTRCKERNQCE